MAACLAWPQQGSAPSPAPIRGGRAAQAASASGSRKPILRFAQDEKGGKEERRDAVSPRVSGAQTWTLVGPAAVNSLGFGLVTGRVSALALDPSDATGNHLFVGTTGGGLWRSQNASASAPGTVQLTPVTDNLAALSGMERAGLSVGAVSVQPGGTGVVLAGLGEPNDALDSYYGAGLLRSADGGNTWTLIEQTMDLEDGLGFQDFSFVGEGFAGFAWSSANPQLVVAAVNQAYEGTLVDAGVTSQSYKGLYWSQDGGATWHLGRITDQNGEDVQGPLDGFAQPDGNAATAVVWNPVRQVFVAAVQFHGYYQSTDGMNWTQLASQPGTGLTPGNCPTEPGGLGVAGCPIFRGSLAVNPQTGDTFAWTVDEFNQDQGIWRDVCGLSGSACSTPLIAFGVQLGTSALEVADENGAATIENGDYNLTLAAVPGGLGAGQDTLLFAGDNDLWKCSLANSCVWRNTTNSTTCASAQVGEYQHALAWDAGNPLLVFDGTDGGLWRSTDQVGETGPVCSASDATHWQNLNSSVAAMAASGSLAEVVSLAQYAPNAGTMLAGLGANGFAGIVNAPSAPGDWNEVLGGEGGAVAIDSSSGVNSWYANNGAGVSIFHCISASPSVACTPAGFGTTPAIGEAQVANDGLTMPYPADFLIDAANNTQLLIGTCRVWRGPANGAGWSAANAISPVLDGTQSAVCDGSALIRTMAAFATSSGSEVVYVGMAGNNDGGGVVPGHVFSTTLNPSGVAGVWTDLAFSPVVNDTLAFNAFGLDVSSLFVDSHDPTGNTVYATIAGFAAAANPLQQLYRSTDGGAHWTAVTSNLPDAPANAVVVDAEDANTVYVGTDVGVYYTRTIAGCATSPCWAAYGSGLPLAPVTALVVTHGGTAGLVLTAGTYGRGIWQIPQATAGASLTTATATPSSLTFASQTVGSSSAAQTVTLKNTGTPPLTVTSVGIAGSAAGDFTESDTCTGIAVATNATCTLKVSFAPTTTGARTATLTINANVVGGEVPVSLSGTGLAAGSLSLAPASLSFTQQLVGTTSAAQSVNVQNTGGSAVAITSSAVTVPFKKASTTCGSSLAAGAGCVVTVEFAPTQAGSTSGTLTVVDGVGTQTAALTGTGVTQATDTLSPTSLSFPGTVVGQLAAPLTVTVTNSGGLPLTGIGTSVQAPFSAVNNCGSQLAAGASCGIVVEFTPVAAGSASGSLVISDALRAQTVKLSGTGLKPGAIKLSASSISFGSQQVNTSGSAKSLTVTNSGGAPLASPAFSISGPGAASFSLGSNTCGVSLAAAGTCTAQLTFTPAASGAITATMTVSSSSPGVAPASLTLSGTGLTPPALDVSPATLSLGSVVVGNSSAAFTVQVSNGGQVMLNEPAFAVSGAQAADFALSAPTDITACTGALNPGASCNIQVTFSPSLVGAESATLTVTGSNAIPSTATVTLSGTGTPSIQLQAVPAQLSFPATSVGTVSPAETAVISNLGKQTANGLAFSVTGPYQLVPAQTNCKATLPHGTSCTVAVVFLPAASGDQPGTLTATVSNLGVAPLVVPLDGTGASVGGISIVPTAMTFGSVVVKTASAAQQITVTNSGQAALTGVSLAATGDFGLSGNQCPATLAAQASCTAGVVFTPSTTGARTGTLTVSTTSAGAVPAAVSLSGNGISSGSLLANPPVVSFGAFTVGQTSPAQTVILNNTGATALAGLQFQLAGDFGLPQNGCGVQLTAGATCSLSVNFSPSQPGTRIGSVTVAASNSGFQPLVVGLAGTGLPTAQLAVSPTSLAFGNVGAGLNSAAMQLTISNPGTGILAGLAITTAAPFSVGSGSCGAALAAGSSCAVPVTFAPLTAGSQSGFVMVSSTSLGVVAVQVRVSGTGLAPASLKLNPSSLSFAGTTVGATSAAQTVTVTDSGGVGISGLTVAATGDFAVTSSSCASTLAAAASCTVVVDFSPSVAGGRTGFLTVTGTETGAAGIPVTGSETLSGTGLTIAVLSASPEQLTFAETQMGLTSATQLVTVSNTGQSAIATLKLAVTAGFVLDATKTNCTATLAAGAHCTVGVFFAPSTAGAVSGSLTASFTGIGAAATTVALQGTGALPPGIATVPAALVQFGITGLGQPATPIAVTVTNPGGLATLTGLSLAINAAGTANGFAITANTCSTTLLPGASCTLSVAFTPAASGSLTGTLTLSSANGGNPVNLALSGTGFDFTIAFVGSGSATVVQGQTAYYTLAVTGVGGNPGTTYSLNCASLPANAVCVFNPSQPATLSAGVAGNVVLGVGTGGPATSARATGRDWGLLLCGLIALPLAWRRKRGEWPPKAPLLLAAALLGMAAVTSCVGAGGGGGSGGQGNLGGGTAPGSYSIPVTVTSDGVSHSVNVTLVVN